MVQGDYVERGYVGESNALKGGVPGAPMPSTELSTVPRQDIRTTGNLYDWPFLEDAVRDHGSVGTRCLPSCT